MAIAIAAAAEPVERGEPAQFILTGHPEAYPKGIVAVSIDHPGPFAEPTKSNEQPSARYLVLLRAGTDVVGAA